jgi:low affinity Fe/Cu permease
MTKRALKHSVRRSLVVATISIIILTVWLLRPTLMNWYAEWQVERKLSKPISVALTETPFDDARVVLSDMLGVEIQLDASIRTKVDDPVTISLTGQPARDVLNAITSQIGASFKVRGAKVNIVPPK